MNVWLLPRETGEGDREAVEGATAPHRCLEVTSN
jgi:hypothetical protein